MPPATRRAISTGLLWKRPEKGNNRIKYKTTRRVWTLRVVFSVWVMGRQDFHQVGFMRRVMRCFA